MRWQGASDVDQAEFVEALEGATRPHAIPVEPDDAGGGEAVECRRDALLGVRFQSGRQVGARISSDAPQELEHHGCLNRIVVDHTPSLRSSNQRGDANKLALAVESE